MVERVIQEISEFLWVLLSFLNFFSAPFSLYKYNSNECWSLLVWLCSSTFWHIQQPKRKYFRILKWNDCCIFQSVVFRTLFWVVNHFNSFSLLRYCAFTLRRWLRPKPPLEVVYFRLNRLQSRLASDHAHLLLSD
jgi:hypothetical protein